MSLFSVLYVSIVHADALEDVVKASQIEIIEPRHIVNELRYLNSNQMHSCLLFV
jgi:hypothetical protein